MVPSPLGVRRLYGPYRLVMMWRTQPTFHVKPPWEGPGRPLRAGVQGVNAPERSRVALRRVIVPWKLAGRAGGGWVDRRVARGRSTGEWRAPHVSSRRGGSQCPLSRWRSSQWLATVPGTAPRFTGVPWETGRGVGEVPARWWPFGWSTLVSMSAVPAFEWAGAPRRPLRERPRRRSVWSVRRRSRGGSTPLIVPWWPVGPCTPRRGCGDLLTHDRMTGAGWSGGFT